MTTSPFDTIWTPHNPVLGWWAEFVAPAQTPPKITATAALIAPSLQEIAIPPVMAATGRLIAPAAGAGGIPVPFMAAAGVLSAPTLAALLTAPNLAASAALRAPVLATMLAAPKLAASAAMIAPTINTGAAISPPVMAAAAAMIAPTVLSGTAVVPPVMAATAVIPAPIVAEFVLPPALSAAGIVRAPTIVTISPAPAFDAIGAGANNLIAAGSLSWTATAAAGSTVIVPIVLTTSGATVSGMIYGGAAMALVGSVPLNNVSTNGILYLFKLAGVPGGAQTVAATLSSSSKGTGNSISYINVTTVGTINTVFGSGLSLSQALACSTNQLIVQAFGDVNGINVATSGGTQRYRPSSVPGMSIQDSPSSVTFTGSTSGSGVWGGVGVVLS